MDIITSHTNTDLDSLSSMVAALKLYPNAKICFSGKINKEVKNFISLHRNTLPSVYSKDIDLDNVTRLIVVDTNSASRIGNFKDILAKKDIEIILYDHHPIARDCVDAKKMYHEMIGSCTAILVEQIIEKDIQITPFEATVMALGIYSDTNCLTFTSTKAKDAKAISFLLGAGANLQVVTEFIGQPLSLEQRELMTHLIGHTQIIEKHGVTIALCHGSRDEFIGELAYITHKIQEIKNVDCIFTVVRMEDKIQIVGKSNGDFLDIQQIMSEFGGGGHKKAGSASVKETSMDKIQYRLKDLINESFKTPVIARDVMNFPVKTVYDDMTIEEVNKIMLRYGHTGLPVICRQDKAMIGIISRTDVDKVIHHGLSHAPVKGYMSRNIVTVAPETPLKEIQKLLIEHNIGRVPVIDKDNLVGIVTRTNVLRMLHGENHPKWYKQLFDTTSKIELNKQEVVSKINILDASVKNVFAKVGEISRTLGYRCYVVGGFVRDLLMGHDNYDVDIVIEGDGIQLAQILAHEMNGKLTVHAAFKTAVVVVNDNFKIDIVTARREYYNHPGALPVVEEDTLWSDLYRRDFTINCLAINLNTDNYGELIDYFGGYKDIISKQVRILYNLSFVEDPTRIFRAIRFEQRFGFSIEKETLYFAKNTMNSAILSQLSWDRILHELNIFFKEECFIKCFDRMVDLGLWNITFPETKLSKNMLEIIVNGIDVLTKLEINHEKLNLNKQILTIFLIHHHQENKSKEFLLKWKLQSHIIDELIDLELNYLDYINSITLQDDLRKKYKLIFGLSNYALGFLAIKEMQIFNRLTIPEVVIAAKAVKLYTTGNDLKSLGLKEGPIYKEIKNQVFEEKIKGNLITKDDELRFILDNFINKK